MQLSVMFQVQVEIGDQTIPTVFVRPLCGESVDEPLSSDSDKMVGQPHRVHRNKHIGHNATTSVNRSTPFGLEQQRVRKMDRICIHQFALLQTLGNILSIFIRSTVVGLLNATP